jgi:hypothetical protein
MLKKLIIFILSNFLFGLNNISFTFAKYYSLNLDKKINKINSNIDTNTNLVSYENIIHTLNDNNDLNKDKILLLVKHNLKPERQEFLEQLISEKKFTNQINLLEGVAAIPILNYYNVQYYSKIFIGSNLQEMTVILDTGSNLLWVSSSNCPSCRSYTNKFCENNSTTFMDMNMQKNITYAIGYVNGSFVQDDVYLYDQMGVKGFKFLLVNQEDYLNGTIADGVLGLGIDIEGDNRNSLVYSLYLNKQISAPFFSFYLTDSKLGSRFYLGDIRENSYLSDIFNFMQYCKVDNNSYYWLCNMQKLSFVNSQSNSTSEIITNSKVIFDTGTSFMLIPALDFLFMIPSFTEKAKEKSCGVTMGLQFICKCNSPRDFDDIVIYFNQETKLNIKTENIIDFFPTQEYQCRFQVIIDIFMLDTWILGDSVLRDSLITFDMENKQIGWIQDVNHLSTLLADRDLKNSKESTYNYLWIGLIVVLVISISFFVYSLTKCSK